MKVALIIFLALCVACVCGIILTACGDDYDETEDEKRNGVISDEK